MLGDGWMDGWTDGRIPRKPIETLSSMWPHVFEMPHTEHINRPRRRGREARWWEDGRGGTLNSLQWDEEKTPSLETWLL